MDKLRVKASYNHVKVLARQHKNEERRFDELCEKCYGIKISEFQAETTEDKVMLDRMIDTLDYGSDNLLFDEFDTWMKTLKRKEGARKEDIDAN